MKLSRLLARLAVVVFGALPAACSRDQDRQPLELNGLTMGTTYTVKIADVPLPAPRAALYKLVSGTLNDLDERLSTYKENSELSRLNRNSSTDWIAVSPDLLAVLDVAMATSRLSGGAFDVTVGPLVNLWGFGPGGQPRRVPGDREISDALARVGYTRLELDPQRPAVRKSLPGLYVDLSAVASGYAVDTVAERLRGLGARNFMVELGGEIRTMGRNQNDAPWRVGIERPAPEQRDVQRIIELNNAGLATSGDYRNYFEEAGVRYSHTIDPANGRPVRHALASVTVVHDSAAHADALACALLVLGPERGYALAQREKLAALFIIRAANGFEEIATPEFAVLANH